MRLSRLHRLLISSLYCACSLSGCADRSAPGANATGPGDANKPTGSPREVTEQEATKMTYRSMETGASLPPLDEFNLDETLQHAIDQKRPRVDLQSLRYYGRKVTRKDLLPFEGKNTAHIVDVDLTDLQLDDADIEPISHLRLARLNLAYNPVRDLHALRGFKVLYELDIDRTQVNDEGLKVVASLPFMRFLHLSGTPFSDAQISYLATLKHLELLTVGDCKNLTPSGIAKLEAMFPHCDIYRQKGPNQQKESSLVDVAMLEKSLIMSGEYAEADLALEKFISNWEKGKRPSDLCFGEAYRLRALCRKKLNHMDDAEKYFKESLKYLEKSGDERTLNLAKMQFAAFYEMKGKRAAALELRTSAMHYYTKHPRQLEEYRFKQGEQ